jgi:hypothetical protein
MIDPICNGLASQRLKNMPGLAVDDASGDAARVTRISDECTICVMNVSFSEIMPAT